MSRFGSEFHRFVEELRRRHVVRVATAYAVAAFVVLQAADLIFEGLLVPSWVYRTLTIVTLLGFPVVLVLAWLFEWTSQGIRRDAADGPVVRLKKSPASETGASVGTVRAFAFVGLGIVIALVGLGLSLPIMYSGRAAAAGDAVAGMPADQDGIVRTSLLADGQAAIAVLPFADLTTAGEDHFGDGLAEDVLAGLAQIDGLQVVSRTTSLGYRDTDKPIRQIGAELGVGLILEGSIRREGDMVRVSAQLIDARTDTHLWARTYDRDASDVFAVQTELAREIVAAVHGVIAPEQTDAAARRLAVGQMDEAGRQYLSGDDVRSDMAAEEIYKSAVETDPTAAPAHAGLSLALAPEALRDTAALREAAEHAARAVQFDPNLPEGHAARAFVFVAQGQMDSARVSMRRAIMLRTDSTLPEHVRKRLERLTIEASEFRVLADVGDVPPAPPVGDSPRVGRVQVSPPAPLPEQPRQ